MRRYLVLELQVLEARSLIAQQVPGTPKHPEHALPCTPADFRARSTFSDTESNKSNIIDARHRADQQNQSEKRIAQEMVGEVLGRGEVADEEEGLGCWGEGRHVGGAKVDRNRPWSRPDARVQG